MNIYLRYCKRCHAPFDIGDEDCELCFECRMKNKEENKKLNGEVQNGRF